jgi:hypothetical protein
MSDFFASLAARIVRREGEPFTGNVRPRLPTMFETLPRESAPPWGELDEHIAPSHTERSAARAQNPVAAMPAGPQLDLPDTRTSSFTTDQSVRRVAAAHPTVVQPLPTSSSAAALMTDGRATELVQRLGAEPTDVNFGREAAQDRPPTVTLPKLPVRAETVQAGAPTISVQVAASHPEPLPISLRPVVDERNEPPRPAPAAVPVPRIADSAPLRAPAQSQPGLLQTAIGPANLQDPIIQVTIGRVEVRAATAPVEQRHEVPRSPVMSLEEYLRSRAGRSIR